MTQQEILKALIKESGLNKKEFAKRYGLHASYLSLVCNGKETYKRATLELICLDCNYIVKTDYVLEKIN